MKLKIADALALPIEAVTEKLAWLGRTGSGKTYGAMKLAELMLAAAAQIVAVDFVGAWYGLRVPGVGAGFPIPVFGGLHGDFPLEPTGGALVADLIVDRAISAVVDVSQFTRADQIRFCLAFATQFFQRKKAAPSAVHLFLEECQEVLPQNAQPNEGAMLGAFERIWKLGRNFGIGGSLISQRPQEVNKKALNMSGTLFVFQMTGPQERKTIESWVTAQGLNEDIADILPRLKNGQPHAWSVAFGEPVSKTIQILQKQTGDVSATPTASKAAKQRPLTPIDAPAITEAMRATVERSKADDPRELRKALAEAKATIAKLESAKPVRGKTVERDILTDADRGLLEKVDAKMQSLALQLGADALPQDVADRIGEQVRLAIFSETQRVLQASDRARAELRDLLDSKRLQKVRDKIATHSHAPTQTFHPTQRSTSGHVAMRATVAPTRPSSGSGESMPPGERAVLTAAAMYDGGVSRDQLGVLTGYKRSSRDAYIARLIGRGWIDPSSNGHIRVSQAGVDALGSSFELLPTGTALLEWWRGRLPEGERKVLDVLVEAFPREVARETIDEITGYKRSSRDAYLSRLYARRLVTSERGTVRAADELFGS